MSTFTRCPQVNVCRSPCLPSSSQCRAPGSRSLTFNSRRVGFRPVSNRGNSLTVRAGANFSYPEWDYVWRYLVDNEMKSVTADEAEKLVASGDWIFLDVRPKDLYEQSHPETAINAPLFQGMDWGNATPQSFLRATAYLLNGVSPVEPNPNFDEQAKEAAAQGKGLIVYCEAGGTLLPSTNFITGKTSRSLKAAYRILFQGVSKDVKHLEGGIFGYYKAGKPLIGEYDTSNVGRTPNAAEAPSGDLVDKARAGKK